jgi:hypothetical protein
MSKDPIVRRLQRVIFVNSIVPSATRARACSPVSGRHGFVRVGMALAILGEASKFVQGNVSTELVEAVSKRSGL